MLGLIENKFIIGRDEFYPFSAEVHYFRVPKRFWSICFDRLKKANFRIISSYVPWNLHEERPGQFDFQGIDNPFKDLIVFLELAREFGFKIILRPGPWIQAEWPDGGIPRYVFADESLIARDASGALLTAKVAAGVRSSYQPCYLHPRFQGHVKRYLSGLVEALQNYIFPKGPVFLIQLDSEIIFGGNRGLFAADYNSHIVTQVYPAFLEAKYGSVKNLPPAYGKVKGFTDITPPTQFALKKLEQLVIYFDWMECKGKIIEDYVTFLKDRLESLGVGCMMSVMIADADDLSLPVPWSRIRGERVLLGPRVAGTDDYCRIEMKARFARSQSLQAWSPQLETGFPHDETGPKPVADYEYQRFVILSALASGLKGMNYYMFVGRDHWCGSPLGEDGTIYPTYEVIRRLNIAIETMELNSMKSVCEIGIGAYRPYHLPDEISTAEVAYVRDLTRQTFPNLMRDLTALGHDFEVVDLEGNRDVESLRLIFVPIACYMAEEVQKRLLELLAKGKTLVLIGDMPETDLLFRSCRVLRRGLRIETKKYYESALVDLGEDTFLAVVYAHVSGKAAARVVAKADGKAVAVFKKFSKATAYFFGYDIASRGHWAKLMGLGKLLSSNGIVSPVRCSDPSVRLSLHFNSRGAALFVINADSSQQPGTFKKVVVAADLSAAGFRQAKTELIDILDDKNISATATELKRGLVLELGRLDSRLYWIARK